MTKQSFWPITCPGLGYQFSSQTQLGAFWEAENFGQAQIACYANVGSAPDAYGNLVIRDHMVKQKEMGFDLEFGFTYNSRAAATDLWHFSLDKHITQFPSNQNGNVLTIVESDGHVRRYQLNPDSNYPYYFAEDFTDGTPFVRFDKETKQWIYYHPGTRVTEYYDSQGLLSRRLDSEGRALVFGYDTKNRVNAITGPTGNGYKIEHQDNIDESGNSRVLIYFVVSKLPEELLLLQSHLFDNEKRLIKTSVGDNQYDINYDYYASGNPLLKSVTQTDTTVLTFGYDAKWGVQYIVRGTNTEATTCQILRDSTTQSRVINGASTAMTITMDNQSQAINIVKPSGVGNEKQTDNHRWTYKNNQVVSHTINDKLQWQQAFNSPYGQLTEHSVPESRQTLKIYGCDPSIPFVCNIIKELIAIGPPEQYASTYYVYEAINPAPSPQSGCAFLRFIITPEGRVREYRPNKQGNIGSVREYLDDFFPTNTVEPNKAPTLAQMQSWAQSIKDKSRVHLQTFKYDNRGNITRARDYAHVDEKGIGIADSEMAEVTKTFDADGQWTLKNTRQSATVTTSHKRKFDFLRRLLLDIDELNAQTKTQYQDAENQKITTLPNNRTETTAWTNANLILNKAVTTTGPNAATQITTYERDAEGHCLVEHLPDGRQIIKFFDKQNRLVFELTPIGALGSTEAKLIEHRYNLTYNYETVIKYNNSVDISKLYSSSNPIPSLTRLQALIPSIKNPELDQQTYLLKNTREQILFEIDGEGFVKQHQYNLRGKENVYVEYVNRLTPQQLTDLLTGKPFTIKEDLQRDYRKHLFHDNDGNVIGWQESAKLETNDNQQTLTGYTTELIINAGTQEVEKIVYGTKTPMTLDFSAAKPLPNPDLDGHHFFFRNNRGDLNADIDPELGMNEYKRMACGLVQESIRYQNDANLNDGNTLDKIRPVPDADNDEHRQKSYDGLNHEIAELTLPLNRNDLKHVDNMGNITHKGAVDVVTSNSTKPDTRMRYFKFDQWQQCYLELNEYAAQKVWAIEQSNIPIEKKKQKIQAIWATKAIKHIFDPISGLKIAMLDPYGNRTVFLYDQARRQIATINARGRIIRTKFNNFDKAEELREYKTAYNNGDISNLTGGYVTQQLLTLLDSMELAEDIVERNKYDRRNLAILTIDPENYKTQTQFNGHQQPTSVTQDIDLVTHDTRTDTHDYDPRKLLAETVKDATQLNVKETFQHDHPLGKLSLHTRPINPVATATIKFGYDRIGRETSETNALGKTARKTWDHFNKIKTRTNFNLKTIQYYYNTKKRLHQTTSAAGRVLLETQDVFQNTHQIQDANNAIVVQTFDAANNRHKLINPLKQVAVDKYNLNNWHTRHSSNGLTMAYKHDSVGNTTQKINDPSCKKYKGKNQTTLYKVDIHNRAIGKQNPRKIWKTKKYDRRSLITQIDLDPRDKNNPKGLGLITKDEYDGLRNRKKRMRGDRNDANQRQQDWSYSHLNHCTNEITDPITKEHPNGLSLTKSYQTNYDNQTVIEADPNGNQIRKIYDLDKNCRFVIADDGAIVQSDYSPTKKRLLKRTFDNRLSMDSVNSITWLTTVADIENMITAQNLESDADSMTSWRYEDDDLCKYEITRLNQTEAVVKEILLDPAGKPWGHKIYSNPINLTYLNSSDPNVVTKLLTPDPLNDRIQLTIHNEGAQICFEMNGDGVVTQKLWGTQGLIIEERKYKQEIDPNIIPLTLIPHDLVAWFSKAVENIAYESEFYVNDVLKRQVYHIDEDGYVNEYLYDEYNNVTHLIRYANPIKPNSNPNLNTIDSIAQALVGNPVFRVSRRFWDNAEREIATMDGLGDIERRKFNIDNKVEIYTDKLGYKWQSIYDGAGRKKATISPLTDLEDINSTPNGTKKGAPKYIRHKSPENGDCGFVSVGITRKEAHHVLLQKAETIKELLRPVLYEALLTDSFLIYLKQRGVIPANVTLRHVIINLDTYFNDINIVKAYINYDVRDKQIDDGWAHPCVLQALAKIAGVNLFIWQLDNQGEIIPHPYFPSIRPENAKARIDLLFSNHNHFEKIDFVALAQNTEKLSGDSFRASVITKFEPDNNGNIVKIQKGNGTDLNDIRDMRELDFKYNCHNNKTNTIAPDVEIDDGSVATPVGNKRPVKKVTLTKTEILNTRGWTVAAQDENGNWFYTIYNNAGHRVFTVNQEKGIVGYQNNVSGQPTLITHYKTPFDFAGHDYTKTGIPLSVMRPFVAANAKPTKDRHIALKYNRRGYKNKAEFDKVLSFLASVNGSGTLGMVAPTKSWHHDCNDLVDIAAEVIDPNKNLFSVKLQWWNKRKKLIATVDANGKATVWNRDNPDNVKMGRRSYYNALDFAKLFTPNGKLISFDKLQGLLEQIADERDHIKRYKRNELSLLQAATYPNQVIQQEGINAEGIPTLTDLPPQDLTTRFQQDAMGRNTIVINANGAKYPTDFNELGLVSKKQKPIRDNVLDEDGQKKSLIEQNQAGYNAHGNEVHSQRSAWNPQTNQKTFIQDTYRKVDNRGQTGILQLPDASQVYKTYGTKLHQLMRDFRYETEPRYINSTMAIVQVLRQLRYDYNALYKLIREHRLNDDLTDIVTEFLINIFGEVDGRGPGNNIYPIRDRRNQVGDVYLTVGDKLYPSVLLRDGCRKLSAVLRSMTQDLKTIKEKDIPGLFLLSYTIIQMTQFLRHPKGDIYRTNLPWRTQNGVLKKPFTLDTKDTWNNTESHTDPANNCVFR